MRPTGLWAPAMRSRSKPRGAGTAVAGRLLLLLALADAGLRCFCCFCCFCCLTGELLLLRRLAGFWAGCLSVQVGCRVAGLTGVGMPALLFAGLGAGGSSTGCCARLGSLGPGAMLASAARWMSTQTVVAVHLRGSWVAACGRTQLQDATFLQVNAALLCTAGKASKLGHELSLCCSAGLQGIGRETGNAGKATAGDQRPISRSICSNTTFLCYRCLSDCRRFGSLAISASIP